MNIKRKQKKHDNVTAALHDTKGEFSVEQQCKIYHQICSITPTNNKIKIYETAQQISYLNSFS